MRQDRHTSELHTCEYTLHLFVRKGHGSHVRDWPHLLIYLNHIVGGCAKKIGRLGQHSQGLVLQKRRVKLLSAVPMKNRSHLPMNFKRDSQKMKQKAHVRDAHAWSQSFSPIQRAWNAQQGTDRAYVRTTWVTRWQRVGNKSKSFLRRRHEKHLTQQYQTGIHHIRK